LYIGVSGGHQRPVAGTLARTKTGLKCDFIKPAWKKHQMSFLKKGAKIHLKNERKINCPTGLKVAEKSTENIQSKFPQCERSEPLFPLNFFLNFHQLLQFTLPWRIAPMKEVLD
jgi:hypothetical protein